MAAVTICSDFGPGNKICHCFHFFSIYFPWSDWTRNHQFSSVQLLSHVRLFETPWIAACQASLSITISQSSLRLTSIESVMPSSHLILSRPLLLLPPVPPSIRVFSNESTLHMRWPTYWSFSFSIIPSKRNHRADLLQNGLVGSCSPRDSQESSPTPQFKCINSLALSLLHSPTLTSIHDHRKTIALTRWTLVGKVMSLLLNMLIYVNDTICMMLCPSSRLNLILLWPKIKHLEPRLSQNTSYGWEAWCHSEFWDIPFFH